MSLKPYKLLSNLTSYQRNCFATYFSFICELFKKNGNKNSLFFVFVFSYLRLKLHFSQNSISLQKAKSKIVFYTVFLCRFILWFLSQQLLINLANSVSFYHFAEYLGYDRREAKTTTRHPNILLGCLAMALTDLMVGLVV